MFSPVKGSRISSGYKGGYRSTGGHDGIDFAAPRGSTAYAFFDGTVLSTRYQGAYGNLVKVKHTDGTIGYYAHLDRFSVKPGQRVRRGTPIGKVGSTGNSTGPHLHVSVYRDGKMQNPSRWLEGTGSYAAGADGGGWGAVPHPTIETIEDQTVYKDPASVLASVPQKAGGFDTPAMAGRQGNPMSLPALLERQSIVTAPASMDLGPAPAGTSSSTTSYRGGDDFAKLINAIGSKESGNNYAAVNKSSGALGKYQIMPGNIRSWSKAALGYSISPQQFLRNPDLQEQIASHRLRTYYKQYGVAGAAQAWYAGEGSLRYSQASLNRKQGAYPSISNYVRDILRRAGIG